MRFCKVPIDGRAFRVTLKLSRWCGPDKWAGFVMSPQNSLGGTAKTMTTRASACNPIDFVSTTGTVRVPQDFISELNPSLIDF